MTDIEEIVRRRAYEIWEEDGRRGDNADDNWFQAKYDLLMASMGKLIVSADAANSKPPKSALRNRKRAK